MNLYVCNYEIIDSTSDAVWLPIHTFTHVQLFYINTGSQASIYMAISPRQYKYH